MGTLIALGKIARTMFAFLVLCTADGRRESGARMELTLRAGTDGRELDDGDEERVDCRDFVSVGDVVLLTAVLSISLGLIPR